MKTLKKSICQLSIHETNKLRLYIPPKPSKLLAESGEDDLSTLAGDVALGGTNTALTGDVPLELFLEDALLRGGRTSQVSHSSVSSSSRSSAA